MKKFLGKKPVWITFLAVAVVLLVVYIGMLVRPVAIGFTYKGKVDLGLGDKTEVSIKVKNGSEVVLNSEMTGEMKVRYVVKGREIAVLSMMGEISDEEFKEVKKEVLDDWDTAKAMGIVYDTNAFNVNMDGENLVCAGSIIFAVVGGIVTAAVITFATLSTIVVVKKKKA